MILHTVNKSARLNTCLQECLSVCGPDDAILFLEDGVYSAVATDQLVLPQTLTLLALEPDLICRGLRDRIDDRVTVISDLDFVRLATEYDKVVSWY